MYSDKVEVLRFETEPYRKHLESTQNGSIKMNGSAKMNSGSRANGNAQYHHIDFHHNQLNNNHIIANHHHQQLKHDTTMIYHNGYHNSLIENEKKKPSSTAIGTATTAAAATAAAAATLHHVQPSDPIIAAVLHSRQNPRPGRLILENVNNRPQTMDRGTQHSAKRQSADDDDDDQFEGISDIITEAPSTSNNDPTNSDLYRHANISVTSQKLAANGGDDSSVDSLNSADSAKRDSEESVIELAEFHQPMIAKDDTDGHPNMSNGDGKYPGAGGKPNGTVKEHPADEDIDRTSCGMECLYFAMQCCECSIM